LFGIKLIYVTIRVVCCNFLKLFGPTLSSSVRVGFNIFLLIDATYWSKISSDHHRYFFAVSLTPFNFSGTLPLNKMIYTLMFSFSSIWDKTCFKNEYIFVIQYYSKHNNRLGSSRQHRTLSGRGTYSCIHFDKKFDKKFNKIYKYKKNVK